MKLKKGHLKLAVLVLTAILVSAPAYAVGLNQGSVKSIKGDAMFKKAGANDWQKLDMGTVLSEGDSVKTGSASEVIMELKGAKKTAEIVVRESSEFVFKTFQHDEGTEIDETLLDISTGAVLVKAEKLVGTSKFEVKTPTSIVGIRGTTFEVKVA